MKQLQILICKGIPASGKSFFSKKLIEKDSSFKRINNDSIRESIGLSFSDKDNKTLRQIRKNIISNLLEQDFNLVIDNVNPTYYQFNEIKSLAEQCGKEILIKEIPFFISLEKAIEIDSKREGNAKVRSKVIKKFWDLLGGESFKHYSPQEILVNKKEENINKL
jgi:predicted kinase